MYNTGTLGVLIIELPWHILTANMTRQKLGFGRLTGKCQMEGSHHSGGGGGHPEPNLTDIVMNNWIIHQISTSSVE